jgi:YjbE family integral membrane protein
VVTWLLIGSIVFVDLTLSGDNALIIGSAMAQLSGGRRWAAMITGGGGAVILRILFALFATVLLQLPLLKAIGGIVLFVIAVRMLRDREKTPTASAEQARPATPTLLSAFMTILVADITTSFDNIMAVGALAGGHNQLLVIGLFLSIVCLLVVSALIARLMAHLTFLVDGAALVLGWTAAHMELDDTRLQPLLVHIPLVSMILPACALISILMLCGRSRWKTLFS